MSRIRIGLAQVNPTVGDFAGNVDIVHASLEECRSRGVCLAAFPELVLCGYPPEDLLLKPAFARANRTALERVAAQTRGLTAIVGFVDRDVDLYNAAAVLHDGQVAAIYRKQRLPNYGVFDELRYFRPGRGELLFEAGEVRVGVTICEDLWLPGGPLARLARAGADLVVNINASPFHLGKWRERHRLLATRASDHAVALAYVNMVGGQDELVFDGGSVVFGADGARIAEAPSFEERLLVCDIDLEHVFRARLHDPRRRHATSDLVPSVTRVRLADSAVVDGASDATEESASAEAGQRDDLADAYHALVLGTRDYLRKNGFERVTLGLSGGLDSSLVAAIAVDAIGPDAVTGVLLPSRYTSEASRADAAALAAALDVPTIELPIEPIFAAALDTLEEPFAGCPSDVTEENVQARIRGMLLMALSNKFGWLLLTTGNKSELATGYATLYGDMAGGFAVIKDVPKTLVFALARWRNAKPPGPVIPESVLTKPPSAELRPDQKDSDSLPPYDVLDPILERYVEQDWSLAEFVAAGYDEPLVRRIMRLVDHAEYKRRQAAPGVKITPRAFGKDRRLPITSRYHTNAQGEAEI